MAVDVVDEPVIHRSVEVVSRFALNPDNAPADQLSAHKVGGFVRRAAPALVRGAAAALKSGHNT